MILIVIQVLLKTFFFLRIFPTLAPIVVMLKTVIYDLRIFMLFYFVLIFMFCQVFAILGLGNKINLDNYSDEGSGIGRLLAKKGGGGGSSKSTVGAQEMNADTGVDQLSGASLDESAKDYNAIGLHFGNFLWTLRVSIGDNSLIEAAKKLEGPENIIFWLLWILVVVTTCIIFLNFIVAEASGSYAKVTETLN
jgi:hypothetical protein